MANRFYTQKQRNRVVLVATQLLLVLGCLLLMKLAPESPCENMSWWIVTAPVWISVLAVLLWLIYVLHVYVVNYRRQFKALLFLFDGWTIGAFIAYLIKLLQ